MSEGSAQEATLGGWQAWGSWGSAPGWRLTLPCQEETPRDGMGRTGGHAAGSILGSTESRSLGAQALHDPVPLHAVEEEEVVVRRVPL